MAATGIRSSREETLHAASPAAVRLADPDLVGAAGFTRARHAFVPPAAEARPREQFPVQGGRNGPQATVNPPSKLPSQSCSWLLEMGSSLPLGAGEQPMTNARSIQRVEELMLRV